MSLSTVSRFLYPIPFYLSVLLYVHSTYPFVVYSNLAIRTLRVRIIGARRIGPGGLKLLQYRTVRSFMSLDIVNRSVTIELFVPNPTPISRSDCMCPSQPDAGYTSRLYTLLCSIKSVDPRKTLIGLYSSVSFDSPHTSLPIMMVNYTISYRKFCAREN